MCGSLFKNSDDASKIFQKVQYALSNVAIYILITCRPLACMPYEALAY